MRLIYCIGDSRHWLKLEGCHIHTHTTSHETETQTGNVLN